MSFFVAIVAVQIVLSLLPLLVLKHRSSEDILKRKVRQRPVLAGLAGVFGLYWSAVLYSYYLRSWKPVCFFLVGSILWAGLFYASGFNLMLNDSAPALSAMAISFISMYFSAFSVRQYAYRVRKAHKVNE